jgi:hypothetical protein
MKEHSMDDINVILAEHVGLGRVSLCACDTVHLTIGPVTLTLSADAFAHAAVLMRNAATQLTEIAAQNTRRPIEAKHRHVTH